MRIPLRVSAGLVFMGGVGTLLGWDSSAVQNLGEVYAASFAVEKKDIVVEAVKRNVTMGHNKKGLRISEEKNIGEILTWMWEENAVWVGDPLEETLGQATSTNSSTIVSVQDQLLDRRDLLDAKNIFQKVQQGKLKLREKMKELYGTHYEALYEPNGQSLGAHFAFKSVTELNENTRGKHQPVTETCLGWNGLIRKLKIKLLQVQLAVLQEQQQQKQKQNDSQCKRYLAKWLWMTAGDKNAAGFSNLFNQSYTMVMQESIRGTFESVGIAFQTRNHAMRALTAAPECAFCTAQFYGSDYDSIFMDFESARYDKWKQGFFAQRAALSANQLPILFSYCSSKPKSPQLLSLQKLNYMGIPVLQYDGAIDFLMDKQIPNSAGKTKEQIEQEMGPNLRWYKCAGTCIGKKDEYRKVCP
jgi:hypothetical protein